MNVTDVQISLVENNGNLKASAVIIIDNAFAVHDIKVINGINGLFMAMPDRKCSDGEYRDVAHPINTETRKMLQDIILSKYEEVIAKKVNK
jgi:stage V sporulation protein G